MIGTCVSMGLTVDGQDPPGSSSRSASRPGAPDDGRVSPASRRTSRTPRSSTTRRSRGTAALRLKLKDGSVIEVKLEIMNILRAGNDPNTGLPAYIVQSAPMVRLVECPKELRKSPLRPRAQGPRKSSAGFA